MKVLLCGEGPHDIGLPNAWDPRKEDYVSLHGWLQPIVMKALGRDLSFQVLRRVNLQLAPRDPQKRSLPGGHGAKAYLAKRAAVTEKFDLLVFMADADSPDYADWKRIVAEIESGFALIAGKTRCVACVPMSASESWLLADPNAWLDFSGYDGVDLPAKPEEIWGERNDPKANHPHRYFARICERSGVNDDRESRMRIAEAMDLRAASTKCPKSFAPFLSGLAV